MKQLPLSIILSFLVAIASCGGNHRKDYEKIVAEWSGKKILFPDSMTTADGLRIAAPTADFTIISYYDSVGCTGCRMRLALWEEFMNRVDSVRGNCTVDLFIIASKADVSELRSLVRRYRFTHVILHDSIDSINSLNVFPKDSRLQTFLLDKIGKVVIIGNPLNSIDLENLYLAYIGEVSLEENKSEEYEFDFGKVAAGEKKSQVFLLRNESGDTLYVKDIITSCECTVGKVSSEKIAPQNTYEVMVSFSDTIPGEFYRSVTLLFENKNKEIRFGISGEIS